MYVAVTPLTRLSYLGETDDILDSTNVCRYLVFGNKQNSGLSGLSTRIIVLVAALEIKRSLKKFKTASERSQYDISETARTKNIYTSCGGFLTTFAR